MFSFVATLAFGSFAMANNVKLLMVVEVESVEVNTNTVENLEQVTLTNCFELADSSANTIGRVFGMDHQAEHFVFLLIYDNCMSQDGGY